MASIALRSLAKARPTHVSPARILPSVLPTTTAAAGASAAPFSTGPALLANSRPPRGAKGAHIVRGKVKTNYKTRTSTPVKARTPGPGERKAFRKRVQLSNNNAVPVSGFGELDGESMASDESSGRVLGVPDRVVDQLRALGAFRPRQSWGLFRRPHVLVRSETVKLGKMMEGAEADKSTLKLVVSGGKVTGKSTMLLQAMSHALLNNWVVIHIPEAFQLTNAHTDYAPIPDTQPPQFCHPSYSFRLLQAIHNANKDVLSAIPATGDYSKVAAFAHLGHDPTLADLAASCREYEQAWATLSALWTELTTVPGRPPVLLTLDGLPFVMRDSAYRDQAFNLVHAHDLSTVRLFTDAISGRAPLVNGGAVIGASGGNDNVKLPSLDLILSQMEAGAAGKEIPQPDPYERRYDDRVFDTLKDAQLIKLGGLTKDEARAVMEYWGASGMFLGTVNEPTVSTNWTLGGHGVVGEMERVVFRNMRT